MTQTTVQPTTTDARFDRIIDAVIANADPDSVDGKFSYEKPQRPRGAFVVSLDGVAYSVSIAPRER